MTILRQLFGARNNLSNPEVPLTAASLISLVGGGTAAYAGKVVTPESALGLSAVWRSVNLISTTCAGLPMHVFRTDSDNVRKLVTTGRAATLVADPHPDLTTLELWELVYGSICLYGNAYLLKLYNQIGVLTELWWVNPNRVKAMRNDAGEKRYVLDGNTENPLSDKLMLHIPGFGYDGVCGVSPIRAAREGLGLSLAAEEFGARFFGSGSLATGILQTEQRIEQDEAERLKALWKQGGSGLDNAHDIRVMGSGTKFQQLTIPAKDAQFLETREFQVTEVARWFGIPPHLLMQTDKATSWGTGIESQNLGLLTYNLKGYLQRVEQRMTKVVKPEAVYVRYALEGLLRGDSKTRSEFYQSLWNMGVLSTNDIRRLEDMAPVEGGDTRYVPLNYGPIGAPTLTELQDPAADPTPEPEPATPASRAADAAAILQQLYLTVGKVITVPEARQIVAAASGLSLAEVESIDVFEDMPPLPVPLPAAPTDDPADPAAPAATDEPGVPADA